MGAEFSSRKIVYDVFREKVFSLDVEDVQAVAIRILSVNSSHKQYLDQSDFLQYFQLESQLSEKLLSIFDSDGEGVVDWRQCLLGLLVCSSGSVQQKSTLLFKLNGVFGHDSITQSVLTKIFETSANSAWRILSDDDNNCNVVSNINSIINGIITKIFKEAKLTSEGKLTLHAFQKWAENNSKVLGSFFTYSEKSQAAVINHNNRLNGGEEAGSPYAAALVPAGKLSYVWNSVLAKQQARVPHQRVKQATCYHRGSLYLLGGMDSHGTLRDFWRYDPTTNVWTLLQARGDNLPRLFHHTMVSYQDNLYVFGGELTNAGWNETPLWIFQTVDKKWTHYKVEGEVKLPVSRRNHTAVVYNKAMHIFGGYVDFRGSTNEFWSFDFEGSSWHLTCDGIVDGPSPRHSHSAVLDPAQGQMWIYGGLTNLTPRADLWNWNFLERKWSRVRFHYGPAELHSHSAVAVLDGMLIFGGEAADGSLKNDLWKFTFSTQTWQKIAPFQNIVPSPRSQHSCVALIAVSPGGGDSSVSLPNLQAAHRPSVCSLQELLAEDHVPRSYSSPMLKGGRGPGPSEVHHFKNQVWPVASEAALRCGPDGPAPPDFSYGIQNRGFLDGDGGSINSFYSTSPPLAGKGQKVQGGVEMDSLLLSQADGGGGTATKPPGPLPSDRAGDPITSLRRCEVDDHRGGVFGKKNKITPVEDDRLLASPGSQRAPGSDATVKNGNHIAPDENGSSSSIGPDSLQAETYSGPAPLPTICVNGADARPRIHARSSTLPSMLAASGSQVNSRNNAPGLTTIQDSNQSQPKFDASIMLYVIGGKETSPISVNQYRPPLSIWRCAIIPGKPTSQRVQEIISQTK